MILYPPHSQPALPTPSHRRSPGVVLLRSLGLLWATFGFFSSHLLTAAESTAVELEVIDASYETWDASTNEWHRTTLQWVYSKGFWHRWKEQVVQYRYRLTLRSHVEADAMRQTYYFVINLPGTYEVFLDGKSIGTNGDVKIEDGMVRELGAGKNRKILLLPPTLLQPGEHEVLLMGYRTPHWVLLNHAGFHLQPLDAMIANERWHIINYGSYLVYFVFGVFFLSTFFTRRDSLVQFYLGTLCILFSTFALNKLAYYHMDLTYRQAAWAIYLVYSVNYVISVFGHLLLFETFRFPRRIAWMLLPIPLLLAAILEGFASYGVLKVAYEWLALVSIVAIFLRRKYAVTASIILVMLSIVYSMRLFEKQQFVIYFVLFLYLLFSIALALYKQHKEKQDAILTNTRLNLELVKNKIQPHFILNSMTSAMEWIESNPKQGVAFLGALAREFEVLSRMTDQKLIPVGMEIDSCRNYLKVMEFRKKAEYHLVLRNVNLNSTLPPSIIRNLLENAISHNSFGTTSVEFVLEETRDKSRRIYTFRSPITNPPTSTHSPEDGTGIQYIKARLMESYKNRWSFSHGPCSQEWVTTIEIH